MRTEYGLLSYRIGNIGHKFMAIGYEELIKKIFPNAVINHYEHHFPWSILNINNKVEKLIKRSLNSKIWNYVYEKQIYRNFLKPLNLSQDYQ